MNKSNQTNVKMKEKYRHRLRRERFGGLGACPQKNFLKQLSLECQKMPFCVVGNHVCIIDFHPGMENMILPSNLCCGNLKKLKTLIFKEESL